ncbi:MAG: hypothetical protein OQK24_13685 [Magnetovibrio sp.]|nr:hypothetical protein [Magnetovibrio sp.]
MNDQHSYSVFNPQAMWDGKLSLAKTFWLWGFVGGFSQLLLCSYVLLGLTDVPDDWVSWMFLAWLVQICIYFLAVYAGIWRSAGNVMDHPDHRIYGLAARIIVILGLFLMVAVIVGLFFAGGAPH